MVEPEEDVVVMGPNGWLEVQRILRGESQLHPNEQTFLLWLGKEIVGEFLEYPAEVQKMSRQTGLSTRGKDVAESLFKRMSERLAELEKSLEEVKHG